MLKCERALAGSTWIFATALCLAMSVSARAMTCAEHSAQPLTTLLRMETDPGERLTALELEAFGRMGSAERPPLISKYLVDAQTRMGRLASLELDPLRSRIAQLMIETDFLRRFSYADLSRHTYIVAMAPTVFKARDQVRTELRELLLKMIEQNEANQQPSTSSEPSSRLSRWWRSLRREPGKLPEVYQLAERLGFKAQDLAARVALIRVGLDRFMRESHVADIYNDLARSEVFSGVSVPWVIASEALSRLPQMSMSETISTLELKPDSKNFLIDEFSVDGRGRGRIIWNRDEQHSPTEFGLPAQMPRGQFVPLPNGRGFVRFDDLSGRSGETSQLTFRRNDTHEVIGRTPREALRRAYLAALVTGEALGPEGWVLERIRDAAGAPRNVIGADVRFNQLWMDYLQFLADSGMLILPYSGISLPHLVFLPTDNPRVLRVMGSSKNHKPEDFIRSLSGRPDLRIERLEVFSTNNIDNVFVAEVSAP